MSIILLIVFAVISIYLGIKLFGWIMENLSTLAVVVFGVVAGGIILHFLHL